MPGGVDDFEAKAAELFSGEEDLAIQPVLTAACHAGPDPQPFAERPPDLESVSVGMLAEMVKIPFDLLAAKFRRKDLALSRTEAIELARPAKVLLDHYLPAISPIQAAWATFGSVLLAIVVPRWQILQEVQAEQAAAQQPRARAAGPGRVREYEAPRRPQSSRDVDEPYEPQHV